MEGEVLTDIDDRGKCKNRRWGVKNQDLGPAVVIDGRAANQGADDEPLGEIEPGECDLYDRNSEYHDRLSKEGPSFDPF